MDQGGRGWLQIVNIMFNRVEGGGYMGYQGGRVVTLFTRVSGVAL